jgi:hypothetical protein
MRKAAVGIALLALGACAPTRMNTACGLATSWDDCAPVPIQRTYNPAAAAAAMQMMQMNNDNYNASQQRQVDIFRAGCLTHTRSNRCGCKQRACGLAT